MPGTLRAFYRRRRNSRCPPAKRPGMGISFGSHGWTRDAVRVTRSRLAETQDSRDFFEKRSIPIGLLDESIVSRIPALQLVERLLGVATRHNDGQFSSSFSQL